MCLLENSTAFMENRNGQLLQYTVSKFGSRDSPLKGRTGWMLTRGSHGLENICQPKKEWGVSFSTGHRNTVFRPAGLTQSYTAAHSSVMFGRHSCCVELNFLTFLHSYSGEDAKTLWTSILRETTPEGYKIMSILIYTCDISLIFEGVL